MNKKIQTMTVYFLAGYDWEPKLPELYLSRKAALQAGRSYFGHPCDPGDKKYAVGIGTLTLEIPEPIKITPELQDYYRRYGRLMGVITGIPEIDDPAIKALNKKHARTLKKLGVKS